MSTGHVIGVDCSTTACKAIIWDERGHIVAEGRAPLALSMPQPTWHEQDAEQWWSATARAIAKAMQIAKPQHLAALAIAHQRETFVPVDTQGQPLRPAILWMDERAGAQIPVLDRLYGRDHVHKVTGKPLAGNLSLTKLRWLYEHEPDILRRACKVLDVHAFLVHRLTERYCTSWGSADPTGLFDMTGARWADDLLAAVGLDHAQMPDLAAPGTVIGGVTPSAAAQCGLPEGLPVVAGLGDGQAAGLGVNVTQPGLAYLNLGTAVVAGTFSEHYVFDPAFRTLCGGIPGTFLLETVILGGTYTVTWFVNQFGRDMAGDGTRPVEDMMEEACRAIPAGSSGLLLVPYWNSVMNPYWDAMASGIVVGWRGTHGRAHLYRAILEGIAFEQRLATSGVEATLGREIEGFVVVGGGARSDLWCQIIADVTGKPVLRSTTTEAAALGAGILAAVGGGLYRDVQEAAKAMVPPPSHRFTPDMTRHRLYTCLYEEVYVHLYPTLQHLLSRLAELSTYDEHGRLVT